MEAKDYDRLEDMLCKELKKIIDKGELTGTSLDVIDKLTHSLKNVYKIQMGYDGGYSGANEYMNGRPYGMNSNYSQGRYSRGGYPGEMYARGYDRGDSYAQDREGTYYVGGHYSHDDGMAQGIMDMMNQPGMTAEQKRTLERALEVIRR